MLMDFLHFALAGFFHFVGVLLLICSAGVAVSRVIRAILSPLTAYTKTRAFVRAFDRAYEERRSHG